ncbi:RHS repeat domain-containing protein [Streptacidiphilus cavernicola]|uniref:RHS repeat-associated core domain-containing protein n=1 Tax=Streptacidiphilus cavernicola TaxID=3342716 RepID=A0ABV6VR60_9ACTN
MFAVTALTALVGMLVPGVALAAQYAKNQVWSPPQTALPHTVPVPGAYATGTARQAAKSAAAPYRVPAVDLPAAGQTATALGQSPVAPLARSRVVSGTPARVGTSPLWVAAATTGAAAPSGVQVRFQDPATARKAGFTTGVVFGVGRGDGTAKAGKVAVQVDPGLLTGEGGADLGSRMRLVQLPACALTTPQSAACRTQTPVSAVSDPSTGRLVADLTLPAAAPAAPSASDAQPQVVTASAVTLNTEAAPAGDSMTVLAAVPGPSGPTGTFAATSLKPSDQWSGGGAAGDFNYSYAIDVPASIGGAAPTVALNYSSSSVDGENASTNSQPSSVGDGWSGVSNFIERSYQSCSQDGIAASGDTCWAYGGHEVSASGDQGGQVVYDDTTGKWHLSSDDGATVTHLTGLTNGAYNGEGWLITLQDGTRMYYGAGKLPTAEGGTGSDTATNSVSTEPVYCPKSTDPCYSATTGTSSYTAAMGYRWNLDFVIDPHGNTTEYTYAQETNYYARSSAHTLTAYDRSSYPTSVEYGWRAADIATEGAKPAPAAKVLFTTATRCVVGSVVSSHTVTAADCASLTATTAPYWPDVPQDQVCASTGTCANYSMAYFSEVRLTQIQTQVNAGTTSASSYKNVDTYALAQSFPAPGDGTSAALRLDSVTRTGNDGTTAVPVPPVSFVYAAMANRVPGAASWPAFNRYRITAINTETGETDNVTYSAPDCNQSTTSPDLPTPSNDTRRCYQEYWTPPGSTLIGDWFEKYTVSEVRQIDTVGGTPTRYTDYTYGGSPAWHRNDSPETANAQRTWDQFRGYGQVTTETGHAPDPITESVTSYLRGMDGDSQSATGGTPRSVTVTDSLGDQITDAGQYAGRAYETQTYDKAGGKVVRDSVTLPWSQLTATHAEGTPTGVPSETAYFVRDAQTVTRGLTADGTTWRTAKTVNLYSPTTGLLTQADAQGDTSQLGTAASQESCTTYTYATAPTSGANTGMVGLPAESTTVAVSTGSGVGTGACPAKTAANSTEDTRTFYDGSTTAGVIPAAGVGNATELDTMGAWSGSTETFTKKLTAPSGTTGYDAYGRPLSSTDVRGDTSTTAYTPATGTLPTSVTATNVTAGNWTTTTTLDQLRQLPTKTVDPNGNSTSKAYDALGRLTSQWAPGRATTASASEVLVYSAGGQSAPTWTETKTIREDGTYRTDFQIYNGFMQLRQDQALSLDSANSNGSLVSDDFYDSHGWKTKTTSTPYYITNAPSSTVYQATDAKVPGQSVTAYDGMGRPVLSSFYSLGQLQWSSPTAYPGVDRTDSSAPSGGTAVSTVVDAQGRTTAVWRYHSNTATGNASDATVTSYSYAQATTAGGGAALRTTITDADAHVRTQLTDAQGNQVASTDPDTGASSATFDTAGDQLTSTDANSTTLTYTYDVLGRKKTLYNGGTELDSWGYDTASGGKGQPATQTSYSGAGSAFTQTIAGYTALGAQTGSTTVVPASEGSLAKTYTVSYDYTPVTGMLDDTNYGADGGLPAETVYDSYTETGTLTNLSGNAGYLTQIVSNPLGQVTRSTLGGMPDQVVLTNDYDTATGRAVESFLDKENGTGHVDDTTTLWNAAGKITAEQDVQDAGTATDLQCFTYNGQGQLATAWTDTAGTSTAASPSVPNIGGCKTSSPSASSNGGPAPYWESYSYDADGNRTGLTTHDTTGATTSSQVSTYPAGAGGQTGQPDTVQSVATTNGTGTTTAAYGYNPDGSTKSVAVKNTAGTTTSNQAYTYDAQGRTSSVTDSTTGNSTGYTYDASGSLIEQKDTVGGHTTTVLYLPGEQLTMNSSGGITALRYYDTGSGPTVIRDNTGNLTYETANGQGTGTVLINSTLTTETRRSFTPYGTSRGTVPSSWIDGRSYLNQPSDPVTGLDLLGARNYDPATGHFLQADPILEAADSNQLGGYTYSADDPVNGADPSGLRPDDCAESGFSCGGGAGGLTVTDPEGQVVNDKSGKVVGHTTPPHTCGVGSCDQSSWGDSDGFAERHQIWSPATNRAWDAAWAPARAALAAQEAAEAQYRAQQEAIAAHAAAVAAATRAAHSGFWGNLWHGVQKDARIGGDLLGDASTVTGLFGGALAFVPGMQEAAAILVGASVGLGAASALAYTVGGDGHDAEFALAGTALAIGTGGFGALGGVVARGASPLATSVAREGLAALIDESGKQAAKVSGRALTGAEERSGTYAKATLAATGALPPALGMTTWNWSNLMADPGTSSW